MLINVKVLKRGKITVRVIKGRGSAKYRLIREYFWS